MIKEESVRFAERKNIYQEMEIVLIAQQIL